jgi:SAM-dependent methyltransferase
MKSAIKEWNGHVGPVLDSKNGFDIIDCEICGFKHATPVPTEKELEEIYRHEYYTEEKPLYIERFKEDLDWWNIAYGDRYDTFEAELPADRRRILDIGSGPGYFLKHGKDRGWDVLGVEPSARAAEHSRILGLDIIEEFLDAGLAKKLGIFDAIHMSEVLEHIPQPASLLHMSHALLNPGGMICIVVPNDYSPFHRALREGHGFEPWWVAPPHHLNYFDLESTETLLRKTGFEIVLREATFPIDIFLLMGDNYLGNDPVGRECHGKRKQFEQSLFKAGMNGLKRELLRELAKLGIGREICVYARKV